MINKKKFSKENNQNSTNQNIAMYHEFFSKVYWVLTAKTDYTKAE